MAEDKGYNAREVWQQVNPSPVLSYDFRSCVCTPGADESEERDQLDVPGGDYRHASSWWRLSLPCTRPVQPFPVLSVSLGCPACALASCAFDGDWSHMMALAVDGVGGWSD